MTPKSKCCGGNCKTKSHEANCHTSTCPAPDGFKQCTCSLKKFESSSPSDEWKDDRGQFFTELAEKLEELYPKGSADRSKALSFNAFANIIHDKVLSSKRDEVVNNLKKKPDLDLAPGFNITAEYRLGEIRGYNQALTEAEVIVKKIMK